MSTYLVGCPNGYSTNYNEISGKYLKDGDVIGVYNTYWLDSSYSTPRARYKTTSFKLPPGRYRIAMWGGTGAFNKGTLKIQHMPGYSEGILTIHEETKFTAAVGQNGDVDEKNTIHASFPDGHAYKGGGGSYLAIRDGDPVYSKIIVAGGSGGFGYSANLSFINDYSSYAGGIVANNGADSRNPNRHGLFGKEAGYYSRGGYTGSGNYVSFGYFGGGGFCPGYPLQSTSYGYPSGGTGYVWTKDTASWYPKDSGSSLSPGDYLESAFTLSPDEYKEKYGSYDLTRTNGSITITVLETYQRKNSNIYRNPEDIVTDLSKLGSGGITVNNAKDIENYTNKEITDMIKSLWT